MKSRLRPAITIIGIILVLVLIALPCLINHIFMTTNITSAIGLNNAEWLNFWGSYLGSAIGGILTLITIYITISFYEKQQDLHIQEVNDAKEAHNQELKDVRTQNEQSRNRKEWLEYMPELDIYYYNKKLCLINRRNIACYSIVLNGQKIVSQLHSCAEIEIDFPSFSDTEEYVLTVKNVLGSAYKFTYALEKLKYNVPFHNSYIPNGATYFIMKKVDKTSENTEVENAY